MNFEYAIWVDDVLIDFKGDFDDLVVGALIPK